MNLAAAGSGAAICRMFDRPSTPLASKSSEGASCATTATGGTCATDVTNDTAYQASSDTGSSAGGGLESSTRDSADEVVFNAELAELSPGEAEPPPSTAAARRAFFRRRNRLRNHKDPGPTRRRSSETSDDSITKAMSRAQGLCHRRKCWKRLCHDDILMVRRGFQGWHVASYMLRIRVLTGPGSADAGVGNRERWRQVRQQLASTVRQTSASVFDEEHRSLKPTYRINNVVVCRVCSCCCVRSSPWATAMLHHTAPDWQGKAQRDRSEYRRSSWVRETDQNKTRKSGRTKRNILGPPRAGMAGRLFPRCRGAGSKLRKERTPPCAML